MQNLLVHRVRNIEYQPSAITALAYTPSQIKPRLLACARENGNIEVWKDEYQELIIPGIRESGVIESLVWIESRLFSAGVDGLVREWDLDSLQAKVQDLFNHSGKLNSLIFKEYCGYSWRISMEHECKLGWTRGWVRGRKRASSRYRNA